MLKVPLGRATSILKRQHSNLNDMVTMKIIKILIFTLGTIILLGLYGTTISMYNKDEDFWIFVLGTGIASLLYMMNIFNLIYDRIRSEASTPSPKLVLIARISHAVSALIAFIFLMGALSELGSFYLTIVGPAIIIFATFTVYHGYMFYRSFQL